jgi:hypothetical protein
VGIRGGLKVQPTTSGPDLQDAVDGNPRRLEVLPISSDGISGCHGWESAAAQSTTYHERTGSPGCRGWESAELSKSNLPRADRISGMPRMGIRGLEFGHFPAPEEPDVCSAPLRRRAGSSGAECLSASSQIVGARLQSH